MQSERLAEKLRQQSQETEKNPLADTVTSTFGDIVTVQAQRIVMGWQEIELDAAKRALNTAVTEETGRNVRKRQGYFASEAYAQRLQQEQEKVTELFSAREAEITQAAQREYAISLAEKIDRILSGWQITIPENTQDREQMLLLLASSYIQEDGTNTFPIGKPSLVVAKELFNRAGIPNAIPIPQENQRRDQGDLEPNAKALGITVERYRELLTKAAFARATYVEVGPFWGKNTEPTWRVAAEPVVLSSEQKMRLELLGEDIWNIADALRMLPQEWKNILGPEMIYDTLPLTVRPDIIIDKDGNIHVNELELCDGARGLMTAHALAYDPKRYKEANKFTGLTPDGIAQTLQSLVGRKNVRAIWIRSSSNADPDAKVFANMIQKASKGTVIVTPYIWRPYLGGKNFDEIEENPDIVLYGTAISQQEICESMGLPPDKVIPQMSYGAIGSKALFPLLFEPSLQVFWRNVLGEERLTRVQSTFIPSRLLTSPQEVKFALKAGKVVKVCGVPAATRSTFEQYTGNGKGIWYLPALDGYERLGVEQLIPQLFAAGCLVMEQDYIPSQIFQIAVNRNGGRSLAPQGGSARICVTYCATNPSNSQNRGIKITAAEATIGDGNKLKPASRDCSYTLVTFGEQI